MGAAADGPAEGRSITPRTIDAFLAETEGWDLPYAAEAAPVETASQRGGRSPRPGSPPARPRADAHGCSSRRTTRTCATYLRGALSTDYDIELVPDGAAALERCLAVRPDIVLADAMMPGLDGFALTRAIRRNSALRHLPVLILSARAAESDTEEGLTSGADDYVSKPFSLTELKARLASNLERSRARLRDAAWRRAVMESFKDALADNRRRLGRSSRSTRGSRSCSGTPPGDGQSPCRTRGGRPPASRRMRASTS